LPQYEITEESWGRVSNLLMETYPAPTTDNQLNQLENTTMNWYEDFTSSNVNRIGYDPSTEECFVEFKDKSNNVTSTWAYSRVSADDFEAIRTAPSVGSAVNRNLVRSGLYSSRKVS
jgi:hypothetical protein